MPLLKLVRATAPCWRSVSTEARYNFTKTLVSKADGHDFSVHIKDLKASSCSYGCHKRHFYSALCVAGACAIELVDKEFGHPGTGQTFILRPGDSIRVPALQPHYFKGLDGSDGQFLLTFIPALRGDEEQDKDGSFPASS